MLDNREWRLGIWSGNGNVSDRFSGWNSLVRHWFAQTCDAQTEGSARAPKRKPQSPSPLDARRTALPRSLLNRKPTFSNAMWEWPEGATVGKQDGSPVSFYMTIRVEGRLLAGDDPKAATSSESLRVLCRDCRNRCLRDPVSSPPRTCIRQCDRTEVHPHWQVADDSTDK